MYELEALVFTGGDSLTGSTTTHWSGLPMSLLGLLKVPAADPQDPPLVYRWLGATDAIEAPSLDSKGCEVGASFTSCSFTEPLPLERFSLEVRFWGAQMPYHKDEVLRQVPGGFMELTLKQSSPHSDGLPSLSAEAYFHFLSDVAVAKLAQEVEWASSPFPVSPTGGEDGLTWMKVGEVNQKAAESKGDRVKADWGFVYAATQEADALSAGSDASPLVSGWASGKGLLPSKPCGKGGAGGVGGSGVAFAFTRSLVVSDEEKTASWDLLLFREETASVDFFGTKMGPLWLHAVSVSSSLSVGDGEEEEGTVGDKPASILMSRLFADKEKYIAELRGLDEYIGNKGMELGGEEYRDMVRLAYREAYGASQLVWNPILLKEWVFVKEMSSNGDMSTVDVIFPAVSQYALFSPERLLLALEPVLVYANNGTHSYGKDLPWKFSFAPHHIGTYPIADLASESPGQEHMPVEESANLLIMIALALDRLGAEGKMETLPVDLSIYREVLLTFSRYLQKSALDPEKQLCTDDFNGELAHNVNLALKGIVGLGAFAKICKQPGVLGVSLEVCEEFEETAKEFGQKWTQMAMTDGKKGGDRHSKLAYDDKNPSAWSSKYNMWAHAALGLSLFDPAETSLLDLSFYRQQRTQFGLPLDSRGPLSKLDWLFWVASLEPSKEDFNAWVRKAWEMANSTGQRVPLTDCFDAGNREGERESKTAGEQLLGFQGRAVVGALFARFWVPEGVLGLPRHGPFIEGSVSGGTVKTSPEGSAAEALEATSDSSEESLVVL
uniref:Glutaminase A central domain-containing protein n=1 Tax=Chromera velia CCMP2878 TaxID=1169474 RepID=A0A0G4ICX1_9ALVE|eukprot:Cvel_13165.t1-p1 / transcript=Cvel_13165.t1 / gene=Cvel_13165 / organism=Chromera_velia_CCMP2878 / gene_product=hypothetical protein / transcript_product=hypothetical protein / location=Cvel_scaffold889:3445-8503(+) / protein_length=779 / sequence_SO=supercontig / SO=protein_coding / is_pseudo=false